MRTALPVLTSTNVAATFPQSRNFRARLPKRQPVTTAMASVAQRSISTKVTSRLRSCPAGSSIPSNFTPCSAMRKPRIWPAHRWPCACSARLSYSARDWRGIALLLNAPEARAEVAEERRGFHDLHAADLVLAPVHFEDGLHHVIDVALRINAARDRQAQ